MAAPVLVTMAHRAGGRAEAFGGEFLAYNALVCCKVAAEQGVALGRRGALLGRLLPHTSAL